MITEIIGVFAGFTVLDLVVMAAALGVAAWWKRRNGRDPGARPAPPRELDVAELCGTLRRLKESLVEARLRDGAGGQSGDELHDAIDAVDRAIEAGTAGSPAFAELYRRASDACEAAAMAQVLGTVRRRPHRRRRAVQRRAPLLR